MKKIFYLILCFTALGGLGNTLSAQEKLKANFSQSVNMENLKEGFISPAYTFTHKEDVYVLLNNTNYKVLYLIYFLKLTPFSTNMSLYKINKSSKGKKGFAETVDIPLKGKMYQFEKAWYKDGKLNIYTSFKDGLNKKKHFFCTQYNFDSKRSETTMIMKVAKKESPALQLSNNEKYMIAVTEKKKDKKSFYINYGILTHDNEWIEQGENILCQLEHDFKTVDYLLSDKGNIIVTAEMYLPRKSILKKKMSTEILFGLKNQQLKKIDLDDTAEYVSPRKLFVDRNGNVRLCHLFGEKSNSFIGISIADINEGNFTLGAHKNFLFKNLVENTLPQGRVGSYQKITKISTAPDGSILILSENFTHRIVTTTRRSGTGQNATYQSNTDHFYDYGPGLIYSFDKDFNHLTSTYFNYKASYKNQDLGSGLDFISTNQNIILFSHKYFYKYERADKKFNGKGKVKFKTKSAMKSFVGQHSEYLFQENTNMAYLFEIISKRQFKIHEYNLN